MVTTEPLVLDASAGVEYLLGRTIGQEVAALIAVARRYGATLITADGRLARVPASALGIAVVSVGG